MDTANHQRNECPKKAFDIMGASRKSMMCDDRKEKDWRSSRERVVELTMLRKIHPRSVVVLFEGFPIWLLVLKNEWVLDVFLPEYKSLGELLEFFDINFNYVSSIICNFNFFHFRYSLFLESLNLL